MNLIEALNNTEKSLNKGGEYCVAFDLIAHLRKEVSEGEVKSKISKKMAFILFKVSPIAFLLTLAFKFSVKLYFYLA